MKMIDPSEIAAALRGVGLAEGDTAMVHSDLSRIGWIRGVKTRDAILDAYFEAFFDVIGADGTLVTLACTESYARHETPFDHAESPSEQGVFSEYIRTRPGAVRSMHPLFSVAAVGRRAERVCGAAVAPTGFGHHSPFHGLREVDARILCIGVDLRAMTFVHHIEQTYGVPYGYTKEWEAPVLRGGQPDDGRYFAFVRYLGAGIDYDFSRFQETLLASGLAKTTPLGYGGVWAVKASDVFDTGIEQLKRDPFFFLAAAPTGEPWKR
jgi:aminoglycoside 3-N-acetyltransferase